MLDIKKRKLNSVVRNARAVLPKVDASALVYPLEPEYRALFENQGGAVWRDIPLPPSENAAYVNLAVDNRVKTPATKRFETDFGLWALSQRYLVDATRAYIAESQSPWVSIRAYIGLERVFHKNGRIRRVDGQNYLKILLDNIAKILMLDDCCFESVLVIKHQAPKDGVNLKILTSHLYDERAVEAELKNDI